VEGNGRPAVPCGKVAAGSTGDRMLKLIVMVTDPGLESVKVYTPVPVPGSVGVPETCQVALPPLLDDFEMIKPGGMGVPEMKLIFGFRNTLIVVHPERTLNGVPTFPVTLTVHPAPEIPRSGSGAIQARIQTLASESFLNISRTYRLSTSKY
jgi:hypothetical protein